MTNISDRLSVQLCIYVESIYSLHIIYLSSIYNLHMTYHLQSIYHLCINYNIYTYTYNLYMNIYVNISFQLQATQPAEWCQWDRQFCRSQASFVDLHANPMVPWQRELLDGIVKFIVIYSNIQCICIYIYIYIYIYTYI